MCDWTQGEGSPGCETGSIDYYDEIARKKGLSPSSTMEDEHVREQETQAILAYLAAYSRTKGARSLTILDAGCGNGYTLSKVRETCADWYVYIGVDRSQGMVDVARKRFENTNVIIDRGDIGSLWHKADVIICQRVLINTLDIKRQAQALDNLISCLNPGGLFISIEAFQKPLERLNEARAEFGLTEIKPLPHNLYLPDSFLEEYGYGLHPFVSEAYLPESNWLSTHYYVSRVLHPALTNSDNRNSHFVKMITVGLVNAGDYSPVKLHVFVK